MKVHEYQAKELMRKYAVPVPRGNAVSDLETARSAIKASGLPCVIKAQIHAGGRGKGRFKEDRGLSGVMIVRSEEEALDIIQRMLGKTLVTSQTGEEGKTVRTVLVEQALSIAKEMYLGIVVDRTTGKIVLMASTEGGMDIERVAAEAPEKITKVWVDIGTGLLRFQVKRILKGLGMDDDEMPFARGMVNSLYEMFVKEDASLIEVNPLAITNDGALLALDAKVVFDDNAAFRHEDHQALRDISEEDPLETEASGFGFNYVKLHGGSVGCMVNGAGLAMATMDLIKMSGGAPANFLDVGGAADSEVIENAFRVLVSDPEVRSVLINIFGGIIACDLVAKGIIEGLQHVGKLTVPVVVRLMGTNAEEGIRILRSSTMKFFVEEDFGEAARKAVQLAGKGGP